MVAEGLGRRPAPKARAEGALRKKMVFLRLIGAFFKRKADSIKEQGHPPLARAFGASAHRAFGPRLRRMCTNSAIQILSNQVRIHSIVHYCLNQLLQML